MKVGTHLTLRMTMSIHVPEWSRARAGRSPMQLTFSGSPSMPVIAPTPGRVLTRSDRRGWQCQGQPLSMMAQLLASVSQLRVMEQVAGLEQEG